MQSVIDDFDGVDGGLGVELLTDGRRVNSSNSNSVRALSDSDGSVSVDWDAPD